jgi:hypothetical protein
LLEALAVAGRPLTDDLLTAITGLAGEAVRAALRELAGARLLVEVMAGEGYRLRHALLAEAVTAGLLPGERAAWHERAARALAAAGEQSLAAEVAGHWAAAGRGGEELTARVAAADAAERVFGYADAASHWQRAIELCQALPMSPAERGPTCRGYTCGLLTPSSQRVTVIVPASWLTRGTGGSADIPILRPQRSSASAPHSCGR